MEGFDVAPIAITDDGLYMVEVQCHRTGCLAPKNCAD